MKFETRLLNENDYDEILVKWWKDWGWEAPLKDFLPNNGTGGLIVFEGEEPICAGFVYLTNSKAAWVDWIISSKTYKKKPNRKEAIKLLIKSLTDMCDDLGAKYLYALIKHKGLIKTYEDSGYIQGDSYSTEMIKKL
mgnify:CR=1 FL=1